MKHLLSIIPVFLISSFAMATTLTFDLRDFNNSVRSDGQIPEVFFATNGKFVEILTPAQLKMDQVACVISTSSAGTGIEQAYSTPVTLTIWGSRRGVYHLSRNSQERGEKGNVSIECMNKTVGTMEPWDVIEAASGGRIKISK